MVVWLRLVEPSALLATADSWLSVAYPPPFQYFHFPRVLSFKTVNCLHGVQLTRKGWR